MGSDVTLNVPEGTGSLEDMPFRDWLHAQRVARAWSFKEFATQLKDAAGEMSDLRPRVTSIETLIRRWESGRTAISDAWLLVVMSVFNEAPAAGPARDVSGRARKILEDSGRG